MTERKLPLTALGRCYLLEVGKIFTIKVLFPSFSWLVQNLCALAGQMTLNSYIQTGGSGKGVSKGGELGLAGINENGA